MSQHWAELLIEDHQTSEKVFEAVAKAFTTAAAPPPEVVRDMLDYFVNYLDGCHNKKEENHLFPLIEQRGIPRQGGPLAVMLQEHEQSRALLATLTATAKAYLAGASDQADELRRVFGDYTTLLRNHFWKENDILYPMARRVLNRNDDEAVVRGITATEAALGPDTHTKYYALADRLIRGGGIQDLVFGLSHELLGPMLNALPVELSFVDADDTVRYFSHENHTKIFPRTRGAIGMKVQSCHPQKSVHLVNQILADFKAGTREVAEFWIDMQGKKVHIRYFPVRDPAGTYVGCLEVVQDIAPIRALTGERRLLDEA